MVKTVNGRAYVLQILKPLQSELKLLRGAVNELLATQLQNNLSLIAEMRAQFLPAIQELLLPLFQQLKAVVQAQPQPAQQAELPEESKHLAEVTILLTKNKDLSRELSSLKGTLDAIKTTHETDLQTLKDVQLHQQAFMSRLIGLLFAGVEERIEENGDERVIEAISELVSGRAQLNERLLKASALLKASLSCFSELKEQVMQLQCDNISPESVLSLISEAFALLESKLDSFPSPTPPIEALEARIDQLISHQDRLAHCALNNHLTWRSKYSALNATVAQLKTQVQSLTSEQAALRLHLQTSQRTASQLSVDLESALQRNRSLEAALSTKNQEFRAKEIEVLKMQGQIEDIELKHRHEMAAVERKVGALEMKLEEQQRKQREVASEDRLSGIQKHRESTESLEKPPERPIAPQMSSLQRANISIDEIPGTIQPDRKRSKLFKLESISYSFLFLVFAFTGIRSDSNKFTKIIADLGGSVCGGINFSEDLTHVLAPPGYVSIRVLGAALSGKWIVPPRWLEACAAQGRWLPEVEHGGFLNNGRKPFRFKTLWMSEAFVAQQARHQNFQTESLRALLTKIGKGRFTERSEEAEILLIADAEVAQYNERHQKEVLTLNGLISKIPIN